MDKRFIKNVLDIEVNGFTGEIRYIVTEMNDVFHEGGYASIEQNIIEDITLSSKEIDDKGGHIEIVNRLKEKYAILDD